MSVDERILRELARDAGPPPADVDLERALASSVVRGRRRRVARRAAVALAFAAAALALAIVAPDVLRSEGPDRAPAGTPRPATPNPLVGSYTTGYFSDVTAKGRFGIHGVQRMTLRADGTGTVQGPDGPPATFTYELDGSEVTVSLWSDTRCRGLPDGRYSFARRLGGGTRFNAISDPCAARRWFFGIGHGHDWRNLGGVRP
jgi:hypothetical protein